MTGDPASRQRERPLLERVELTNIGPFSQLSVALTSGWNVLLGDNGLGKTIVLRSVAAALCGEAVDTTSVKRLLKSDADWGAIELVVGSRTYSVELKRDADGEVEIVSTSLSPLKLDNWLVIGFPALRSVTWKRPRGPGAEDGPAQPVPADLLPILLGEPDERLADLKQWLLNLDYRASAKGRRAPAQRARRLYDRFFEVLNQLASGLELKPHPIDREAREVLIEADGRVVPLSAVSQGTGSVICWVGTLLQRLHQVNVSDRDPEARGALVLVDEIDAHMHPGWQRLVPDRIRELFPSVQVLATTHSPLIVSSLAPEEIQLVRRSPLLAATDGIARVTKLDDKTREIWVETANETERPAARHQLPLAVELTVADGETVEANDPLTRSEVAIIAEKLPFDIRGWRADQILTGPLFNLQSARNPKVESALVRYTELAARENPSEEERSELEQLARLLDVRLPNPAERVEARQAYGMIRDAIAERTRRMPPEAQKRLIEEVKVQLQESVTGSRRPS